MSEETTQTNTPETETTPVKKAFVKRAPQKGGKRPGGDRRQPRPKPEFDQKILSIRRVTRVVSGGRRFSFSVAMVIGDRQGSVGVGIGKAGDTSLAIQKALNAAKRSMITLTLTDDRSIKHEIEAKYNSARISLFPNYGRGVVAGSAVRSLVELAGMKDVTGKVLSRSKNQLNIARAAMKAFTAFGKPYAKKVAEVSKVTS